MTLLGLILLIVVLGMLIWLVPQLPAPWRWITVAVLVVVCVVVLVSLLGGPSLGLRLR
jgi:hypothetical protein